MGKTWEVYDRTGANWPRWLHGALDATYETREDAEAAAYELALRFAAKHGGVSTPDLRVREVQP